MAQPLKTYDKLDIDEFVNLLKCPVTKKIFLKPVLTNDGDVYEEQIIIQKGEDYTPLKNLKSLIESLLYKYPEYTKQQYSIDQDIKIEKKHKLFNTAVTNIINSKEYNKLKDYVCYDLKLFDSSHLQRLTSPHVPEDVIKHIIDNTIDINAPTEIHGGWTLLNYLCSAPDNHHKLIKYLIEKGANILSVCPGDGWYALHQVVKFSKNDDFIKWFIDQHLAKGDLFVWNSSGQNILSLIMQYSHKNIIEHALGKINISLQTFKENIGELLHYINMNQKISETDREEIINILMTSL